MSESHGCDTQAEGQGHGTRQRRLYRPGERGRILTYALECNEDWHDRLMWAVRAHDVPGCLPVTTATRRGQRATFILGQSKKN